MQYSPIDELAIKAVFELQYPTAKAVRFIQGQFPKVDEKTARQTIAFVAKPRTASK